MWSINGERPIVATDDTNQALMPFQGDLPDAGELVKLELEAGSWSTTG